MGTGIVGPSTRTTAEWALVRDAAEWLAERTRITAKYGPDVFGIIVPGMPAPEETRPRHDGAPQGGSAGEGILSGRTSDSRPAEPQQRAGRPAALVAALAEAAAAASEDLRLWVDDSMDRYHHLLPRGL
jgi:hypothetical protein